MKSTLMNKKLWNICLKWGLLLGAMLSILELVKMVARNVQYGSTQVFDIAMIVGYILVLYSAVKEFKDHYPARLSFPKAFMACLIVSFIGSVLLFGYDMVHYAVIERDGLQKKYDTALQNFKTVVDKDTVTADELTYYLDTVKVMIAQEEKTVLSDNTISDSVCKNIQKGIDMISRFYDEKVTLQRKTDTANNYRLGNFSAYGRKVLMETLSIYVSQNEEEASTPYVQDAIQGVNSQLAQVNMADKRFEENKSHVPHYEKPGRYAAVCAMMDMLYGMFFGLFIALFHYRSKNTIEDVQPAYVGNNEEENIPQDENLKNE
ncbi:MAG: DUF4199 domain-containing protein [Bacteroidales bacterium]|nr:DUF4199 domain-containing protein [Bacteroidales bacterium]